MARFEPRPGQHRALRRCEGGGAGAPGPPWRFRLRQCWVPAGAADPMLGHSSAPTCRPAVNRCRRETFASATMIRTSVPASRSLDTADPLARYREKRDFARTAEPRGEVARPTSKAGTGLRFVVQKHAATRLHFDLRLELGGVLKSWAVARGPSLDPADKRLAVEVEDHPVEYCSFEGAIEAGYGAGTVMLWDEGTWELAPEVSDATEALAKGNLKFVLHGQRLRGGWDLVRMKPRPKERQPQWLLIKRRDEEARPGEGDRLVDEATTSISSGRTMEQIAGGAPASAKPRAAAKRTA